MQFLSRLLDGSTLRQRLRRSPARTSTLLLAASLGVGAIVPSYAAAIVPRATATGQQDQLISQRAPVEITLVTYAVTKAAYDAIIPLFVESWKQAHNGQQVTVNASYGGSGSQTRAVLDGLEADVVQLALALDTEKLEQGGLINPGWEQEAPNGAIVTNSVVALVTRQGNPKGIRTWSDLAKPGIQVITANPKTSGGARWNFLGLWGSITQTGGTESQAQAFVRQVYGSAPVLPRDAREATETFFRNGQGDVLLNYENEVILAGQQGQRDFFSVIPPDNISISGPVAVVDRNVDRHNTRQVSEAFVQFLYTPAAQREFAKAGFRPVNTEVAREFQNRFPRVSRLYTVEDLGGWDAIQQKFFADNAIFDQIYQPSR